MTPKDLIIRSIEKQCVNLTLLSLWDIEGRITKECSEHLKGISNSIQFELEKLKKLDANFNEIEYCECEQKHDVEIICLEPAEAICCNCRKMVNNQKWLGEEDDD